MICERCEGEFETLQEFKYVVAYEEGTLELTTYYCEECANYCEQDVEDRRSK